MHNPTGNYFKEAGLIAFNPWQQAPARSIVDVNFPNSRQGDRYIHKVEELMANAPPW